MTKIDRKSRQLFSVLYSKTRIVVLAIDCAAWKTAMDASTLSVVMKVSYEDDEALRWAMLDTDHWNPAEIRKRKESGDRCYQVMDGMKCIHYSWLSTRTLSILEVGYSGTLSARQRWIYDGYTHPSHRGKSIFPRVLTAIVADAVKEGCETVFIGVDEVNAPSLKAILKTGFVKAVLLERTVLLSRIFRGRKRTAIDARFAKRFDDLPSETKFSVG